MRAQHVVRMFDRADDEDVLAHELGASPSSTARKDVDQREEGDDDHSRDSDDGDGGSGEDHHR
jgi:phage terminase small subunit